MPSIISEYEAPWAFPQASEGGIRQRLIYSTGQGPSILVLHELPGLTEGALRLGLILAQKVPARVHLPLLLGSPEPGYFDRAANILHVCLSREIHLFAANRTSPIVNWLRALCEELRKKDRSNAPGIGVVGMCLTGGFALALVAEQSVVAPVIAQPSLPLFIHRASLGLSETDLTKVKARAVAMGPRSVLALRYEADCICPRTRIGAIGAEIGQALDYKELQGRGHSTLTDSHGASAIASTIAFLSGRLQTRTRN